MIEKLFDFLAGAGGAVGLLGSLWLIFKYRQRKDQKSLIEFYERVYKRKNLDDEIRDRIDAMPDSELSDSSRKFYSQKRRP